MADIYLIEIPAGSDVALIEPGVPKVSVVANFLQTFAIGAPKVAVVADFAQGFSIEGDGSLDVALVSAERIVVFEASGGRVVVFESSGTRVRFGQMSGKIPYKVGDKWMVDRDPDEESYYAADITEELVARNTTAVQNQLITVLSGVSELAAPVVQTATVAGVQRTFVVAFLGGVDGDLPADWFWTARVRCANGERFDKTTHFNRKDG